MSTSKNWAPGAAGESVSSPCPLYFVDGGLFLTPATLPVGAAGLPEHTLGGAGRGMSFWDDTVPETFCGNPPVAARRSHTFLGRHSFYAESAAPPPAA